MKAICNNCGKTIIYCEKKRPTKIISWWIHIEKGEQLCWENQKDIATPTEDLSLYKSIGTL